MNNRTVKVLEYLQKHGWMGELGLGFLFGVVVGLPVHLFGPGQAVWGVPSSMVWGGSTAAGAFLLSASLRLIPSD